MNNYRDTEKFFHEILGKTEPILAENDFILSDTNGAGMLYYPQSFWTLINTRPVKRMARIFQTGTKIYGVDNMSHTRLEHSKGTYYRTLELLQNIYNDDQVRSIIQENNYQKYVVVELLRALLHDMGHGPFSHTMETVCDLPKGFHEEIGLRIIKENDEIRDALEAICPNFQEVYEEAIAKNFLGLNRIFEGQCDLDRGDFLPRDSFFADKRFQENSKIVSEIFNSIKIEKVKDSKGSTNLVPVFGANQIGNLDKFFKNRFDNYKDVYYNNIGESYDYVFKSFATRLIQSDESYNLKTFLQHNVGKKPGEVDLQEYIEYDDIEYLKGIMEVAERTSDPILRDLALLSLPSGEKADDFYYGLMVSMEQVNEEGNRRYTSKSDEEFIRRLYKLKNNRGLFQQNCILLNSNKQADVENVVKRIRDALGFDIGMNLEEIGIVSWKKKITSYKNKPGEEVYVRGKDDKIYEYSQHPERKQPILETTVSGFCVLTPLLKLHGYTKQQIEQVIQIVNEYNMELEEEAKEEK